MTSPTNNRSARSFSVAPAIIRHLVSSQAGSLEKAVAEGIMNSIDAGATSIDITTSKTTIVIRDNGQGFPTLESIEECFSVFGFDHDVKDDRYSRVYGRFGLGRAQMWAYASTVWRTRTFMMDVNIRTRGLDYDLTEGLADEPGLTINATLYEPLTNLQHTQLVAGITELCRYCTVPVTVNGDIVSRNPADEQWTIETGEAYLRITESRMLKVYNQGIYVCPVNVGYSGIGGILVTKRDANLLLNMARNDVLRDQCPLWKKLHALCKKEAGKRVVKQKARRINDAERDFLAQQTADPSEIGAAIEEPIFTLCNSRHLRWSQLRKMVGRRDLPLTVAPIGSLIGAKLLDGQQAIVLSPATLERFGAETIGKFLATLSERFEAALESDQQSDESHLWQWSRDVVRRLLDSDRICEQIADVPAYKTLEAKVIPDADLSAPQRSFLEAMRTAEYHVRRAIDAHNENEGESQRVRRKLLIGQSEACEAYTDGAQYIAICDHVVAGALKAGLPGFRKAVHLTLHEYLHDESTAGSHQHDHDFYQSFHDIVCDQGAYLDEAAAEAFKVYLGRAKRMSRTHARQIDLVEAAAA